MTKHALARPARPVEVLRPLELRPVPRLAAATTTVVGAAAPFAANSYARLRLIRQMHAAGLLSGRIAGTQAARRS